MPDFTDKELYDLILEFSKQSAAENLLGNGVDVNFLDTILETLNSNVVSGSNLDNLVDELKTVITGGKGEAGLLQRYMSQVTNDALTQFNATYNQTLTQDLGIEWYKYTGTKIEKTRPFCRHFVNDYFHKKEVEKLGNGIDPLTGSSLSSENLTAGRIKSTNSSNIFINRGGWHCRHFFSPITARYVPKEVLLRNIKNGNFKPSEREKTFLGGSESSDGGGGII